MSQKLNLWERGAKGYWQIISDNGQINIKRQKYKIKCPIITNDEFFKQFYFSMHFLKILLFNIFMHKSEMCKKYIRTNSHMWKSK